MSSGWEDHLFGNSTKQKDGIIKPSGRRLKHVTTPGGYKGLAIGNLDKYKLKKSKKK